MGNKEFYGSDNPIGLTYLEFGEIDQVNVKKNIWGFKLHQKAYDWFMLARYTNDILAIRKMQELLSAEKVAEYRKLYHNEVHHKNELNLAFGKLSVLAATRNQNSHLSFFELGQTLFGCIDAMEFCLSLLKRHTNRDLSFNLKDIDWIGLDISNMFNELAKVFYNNYNVITASNKQSLPNKWNVFYSKGITLLYVVREIGQLYEYINSSECAYFDYSFSLKGNIDTTIGSGKTVRYLDLKDFLTSSSKNIGNKEIYINTKTSKQILEKNQIWFECIAANKHTFEKFIEAENQVFECIDNLEKQSGFVDLNIFDKNYHRSWVKLEDFLKNNDVL